MKAFASPMAVGDYCTDLNLNKIIVNSVYQRSPKVWPPQARSFFVESIILGYPIPKIFLYAKTDLKTKSTIKEIVDGQQRSMAIRDFYNNRLTLSKNIETEALQGKKYTTLRPEEQEAFLSYSLPIDQFVNVTESSVREAFRRMNSNNVPLNDEEKRHAVYQGDFKWFINSLASHYRDKLSAKSVMSARDMIRMADFKLLADVVFAILKGIQTTKSKQLDDLYKEYDKGFELAEALSLQLRNALDAALDLENLATSNFSRAHVFYGLVIAHYANLFPTPVLNSAIAAGRAMAANDIDELDLVDLNALLDDPEGNPEHPFVQACQVKTNVKDQREVRVAYIHAALVKAA